MNKEEQYLYDAVVIGGGPAGLTAALYLARAGCRVLVVERDQLGGQITLTAEVVNYPGILHTDGKTLTETMHRQAQSFGAEFLSAEVTGIVPDGDLKTVHTSAGDRFCFCILIATGAYPRTIGFAGETEFRGRGIAYCATCDGEFFVGKEVFVIGGGYAAAEESVFLTKFASHVTVLVREPDFTCAAAVAQKAKNHEKITVLYNTEVESVTGDTVLRAIRYRNNRTGESTEYHAPDGDRIGVFVFAGYLPATALLEGCVITNEQGYIRTDADGRTSRDGIFAAGDVCEKTLRQLVTATSDGASAATEMERYADRMREKTGRHPKGRRTGDTSAETVPSGESGRFSAEIRQQLQAMFSRMERPLTLKLSLDERPISAELRADMEALAAETDRLTVEIDEDPAAADLPCVRIFRNGVWSGLAFHGIPGGHEFTSFVLGLYNASGPGQTLEPDLVEAAAAITDDIHLRLLVTLSCTMCPELVIAAQHLAAINPHIRAEVYDIRHFPKLQEQYQVMSVPCLVINDQETVFGKKNFRQLLELLNKECRKQMTGLQHF